ncbi:MAG TPA: 50S ribosomal protein L35, partial [Verrucomicrobiae bacterium]|nr:50S ribosomal protein L35 [Verrucomicrobiae bacterium]
LTATGKAIHFPAGRRHLAQSKNAKRRRRLAKASVVHETDLYRITQNLPFSH